MIVRLMGLGQWRLDDAAISELNRIDELLDTDLDADDGARFATHLAAMHELVHSRGEPLADDEIAPSEAFVPPLDSTLEELRTLLGPEGLIPG